MAQRKYNILCNGRNIYKSLTEKEYFEVMDELRILYYKTGSPKPYEIEGKSYTDHYSTEDN